MNLADLEAEVLGYLMDDYENAESLTQDVSREIGISLSEEAIAGALASLQERGLADRYLFNATPGTFEVAPASHEYQTKDFWFMASMEGRARILSTQSGPTVVRSLQTK